MNIADVAPQPTVSLGIVACAGLVCLFVASAVVLTIVLVRRSRKNSAG